MTTPAKNPPCDDAGSNRELEKAIASGVSTRTREQIHAEARERTIIAGIERGHADMRTGNTVPHDAAMAELDTLIDELCGPRGGGL